MFELRSDFSKPLLRSNNEGTLIPLQPSELERYNPNGIQLSSKCIYLRLCILHCP